MHGNHRERDENDRRAAHSDEDNHTPRLSSAHMQKVKGNVATLALMGNNNYQVISYTHNRKQ